MLHKIRVALTCFRTGVVPGYLLGKSKCKEFGYERRNLSLEQFSRIEQFI